MLSNRLLPFDCLLPDRYFHNNHVPVPYKGRKNLNPEKPDVPLNKNDAFQKVQKRRVQEKR